MTLTSQQEADALLEEWWRERDQKKLHSQCNHRDRTSAARTEFNSEGATQ